MSCCNDPKTRELKRIYYMMDSYDCPDRLRKIIERTLTEWKGWFEECDGATFIDERWPSKYPIWAIVHDDYRRHRPEVSPMDADLITKEILEVFHPNNKRYVLWVFLLLRSSWIFLGK